VIPDNDRMVAADLFGWSELRFHNSSFSSLRLTTSVALLSPRLGFFCSQIAQKVEGSNGAASSGDAE
jgi:hypothetical protein